MATPTERSHRGYEDGTRTATASGPPRSTSAFAFLTGVASSCSAKVMRAGRSRLEGIDEIDSLLSRGAELLEAVDAPFAFVVPEKSLAFPGPTRELLHPALTAALEAGINAGA